jgi:polar amino acid transport system substrate-binding protein
MKFKRFAAAAVALAFGIGLMSTIPKAQAMDQNDPNYVLHEIQARGTLRVPVMVGEEPGYIKDPNSGKWSGFYTDFLQSIADDLHVKLVPVETTWGNLAADFQADKIDVAIGVNPNPQRGLVVDYLWEPIFIDAWAMLTPKGKLVKNWADLNDPSKTVVVQSGSTMQIVAQNLVPKAHIVPVPDRGTAILELRSGRADGILLAVFDALQVKQQGIGDVSLPSPLLRNPATLCVARQPGNAGFINFLTNWVEQQRSMGVAQAALAKAWTARGIDLSILPAGFTF